MKNIVRFIAFFFIWLISGTANAQYNTGLLFRSHEVNKDERTSLDLTPDELINIANGFSITFDLKLSNAPSSYGYVFRIIANDTASLDMTSYFRDRRISLILNNPKGAIASYEYKFDSNKLYNKWVKVIVKVDKNSILCYIDDFKILLPASFKEPKQAKIFFGSNRHEHFYTSDVALMSVKDIVIKSKDGQVLRQWKMSKHGHNVIYDEVGNFPATVHNGVWEIDKHTRWKKVQSLNLDALNPQIAYDSVRAKVFVATKDSLFIMNVRTNEIEKLKVKRGNPFFGASASQLIFDYKSEQLISYDIDDERLIFYDFKTNEWSDGQTNNAVRIQHHNRFINEEDNELVVFGGYGFFKYKAILATHSLKGGSWTYTDLIGKITPRYLASMGYLGKGKLLVFGGYGSKTGIQEQFAKNLYDLYEVDSKTKSCVRLGELSDVKEHIAFSNSMVFGRTNEVFYTLGYKNDVYKSTINLFAINRKDMSHEIIADSIPYNFLDIESYCDLFLYKDSILYTIVSQKTENGTSLSIYSLMYLPLSKADVLQGVPNLRLKLGEFILCLILVLSVFGAAYFFRCRYKSSKKKPLPKVVVSLLRKEEEGLKAAILMLGGFRVVDSSGKDITNGFTPVIRQILIMMLLESHPIGRGITSERIDQMFWPEMEKDKATNNRNVNISKLRILLQELKGITIVKLKGYWQVSFDQGVYCDYIHVMALLKEINNNEGLDKSQVEEVINCALSGVLLPETEADWIDKYKSDQSNLLIDVLTRAGSDDSIIGDLKLAVKLADVVLLHDNLNEDAIQLKCRSLYHLGQKGLSKQCYDKYCADYKGMLNEQPKLTYETIIAAIK